MAIPLDAQTFTAECVSELLAEAEAESMPCPFMRAALCLARIKTIYLLVMLCGSLTKVFPIRGGLKSVRLVWEKALE